MPLQDFNSDFRGNAYIAFTEIYAARRLPQTSHIVDRLPVFAEPSLSAFKFIAQLRCLRRIPLRILGSHVRSRRRCRRWPFFFDSTHDGNQTETVEFFEIVIRPNHRVLTVSPCVRPI